MKKLLVGLISLFAASAALAPSAGAQFFNPGGKVAVYGDVGWAWYAMDTINDELDLVNDSGFLSENFDKISGGLNAGGGVDVFLLDNMLLGVEAQYLGAGSKATLIGGGDDKLDLPGMEAGLRARYVMPFSDMFLVSLGAGLAYYFSWWHSDAAGTVNDFSGSQLGWNVGLGVETFLIPNFMSVGVDAKYRWAKIDEIKDSDDNVLQKSNGEDADVDYTGPAVLGFAKFYF